jgi:uncharacterized membrane protein HdeD (DUF308 family)
VSSISSTEVLQVPLAVEKITRPDLFAVLMFVFLGTAAIIDPAAGSMKVTLLVGWLLIAGGIGSLIKGFKGKKGIASIAHVLINLLCVVAGVYCLTHPMLAMSTLTFPYRKCLNWSRR